MSLFFAAFQVYSELLQLLKIFIDFKSTTKLSYLFNIMNLLSVNVNGCLKIWCPIHCSKFVKFLLPPAISSLDKEIDNWWNYYFWSVSVFPKAIYLSTRRHPAAMPRESTFFCLILAVYLLMPFCYPLVWRVGVETVW